MQGTQQQLKHVETFEPQSLQRSQRLCTGFQEAPGFTQEDPSFWILLKNRASVLFCSRVLETSCILYLLETWKVVIISSTATGTF